MKGRCAHAHWKFPNPYPQLGEPCPDCGVEFSVSLATMQWLPAAGRDEIEEYRALGMCLALPLLTDEKEITPTQKSRLRYRIARKRGWTTAPELEAVGSDDHHGV